MPDKGSKENAIIDDPNTSKTELVPKKKMSEEKRRRQSLLKKGSASASDNFARFIKNNKKEQDPEKKAAADKLLRKVLWDQKCTVALVLPLSFLATIPVMFTPDYIG